MVVVICVAISEACLKITFYFLNWNSEDPDPWKKINNKSKKLS